MSKYFVFLETPKHSAGRDMDKSTDMLILHASEMCTSSMMPAQIEKSDFDVRPVIQLLHRFFAKQDFNFQAEMCMSNI